MKIYSDDGKVFNSVDECNDYEADQKLKKQREQEEKAKVVAKAEAERKAKEETREKAMKWVTDSVDLVNQAVERYEKETSEKLEYVTVNGKLTTQSVGYIGKYIGMPIINLSTAGTHDNWWNDLYKELRRI